jgi:hypothetical protein
VPVVAVNNVSRHLGSSVGVAIFALLTAEPARRRGVPARSAGFQTCCIADFQVGRVLENARPTGLETRDSADLEVCAAVGRAGCAAAATAQIFSLNCLPQRMEYQRENGFAVNRRACHENN